MDAAWLEEFPGAVTVCDKHGTILAMNAKARKLEPDKDLIGSNLLDCHPEPARSKLQGMLARGEKNVYTIEKRGVRKLIFQSPWYEGGAYAGLVELSLEIPAELPHFVRK
jgi:transcriptional regulator with PAS, ATPase and Fis domain